MDARRRLPTDEKDDELERVVARIRMRGPGLMEPSPSPDAIATALAHGGNDEPMSGEELAEHERMWQGVDAELEALDRSERIISSVGDDPV